MLAQASFIIYTVKDRWLRLFTKSQLEGFTENANTIFIYLYSLPENTGDVRLIIRGRNSGDSWEETYRLPEDLKPGARVFIPVVFTKEESEILVYSSADTRLEMSLMRSDVLSNSLEVLPVIVSYSEGEIEMVTEIVIVDPNDNTRKAMFDSLIPVPIFMDTYKHGVHMGRAFATCSVDTTMALNETLVIAFKTPTGNCWFHSVAAYSCKAAGHLNILEAPTWDALSGSQLPVHNRNRNSSYLSTILENQSDPIGFIASQNAILNPDNLAGGTAIRSDYVFADKKMGGGDRQEIEFMLKADTAYAIRFTADIGTNAAQIRMIWFEHTNM